MKKLDLDKHEERMQQRLRCTRKARWWYRQRRNATTLSWLLVLWLMLYALFGEQPIYGAAALGAAMGMLVQYALIQFCQLAEHNRRAWYQRSKK